MGQVVQRGKKMDSRKQPSIPRKRLEAKWSKRIAGSPDSVKSRHDDPDI